MISQLLSLLSRAIREPALHTTAALASVPAANAGLKAVGVSTDLDPSALAGGLFASTLWITLGVAAVFGGHGRLSHGPGPHACAGVRGSGFRVRGGRSRDRRP